MSSAFWIIISVLIFGVMLCTLLYAEQHGAVDLSDDIIGSWQGLQYYIGTEKTVCAKSDPVTLSFDGTRFQAAAKGFPCVDSDYTCSGSSISFRANGKETTAFLSVSENGLLELKVPDWDLNLSLKSAE